MTNKNQVTVTPNCFYGCIDDSTPCGKAKAEQVKAYMEILTMILQDNNLSPEIKQAIYIDYAKAIREYVEREETCCDCTNDCDCKCEEEEEEEPYEEEEEITLNDIEKYVIHFGESGKIDCKSYLETTEKLELLIKLGGFTPIVYGLDGKGGMYRLDIIDTYNGIFLEMSE